MLREIEGNILESDAEALVNTVNTVGVMGKGIALLFKQAYPHNYSVYKEAHKNNELSIGKLLIVEDGDLINKKIIINFPTKKHWLHPSKLQYIESGLETLKGVIVERKLKSIAIPPLGCGHGGLDWAEVRQLIHDQLEGLNCEITLYKPTQNIKVPSVKPEKTVKLSPGRAILLHSLFLYESLGEVSSLFAANKLAYFIQHLGEPLNLKFSKHFYGPYTPQLNHVMLYFEGTFISGMAQNEAKPFDPIKLNYERSEEVATYIDETLNSTQKARLEKLNNLLRGFETTYSLELLSTVDYAARALNTQDASEISSYVAQWSERKSNLFPMRDIEITLKRLREQFDYSESFPESTDR